MSKEEFDIMKEATKKAKQNCGMIALDYANEKWSLYNQMKARAEIQQKIIALETEMESGYYAPMIFENLEAQHDELTQKTIELDKTIDDAIKKLSAATLAKQIAGCELTPRKSPKPKSESTAFSLNPFF